MTTLLSSLQPPCTSPRSLGSKTASGTSPGREVERRFLALNANMPGRLKSTPACTPEKEREREDVTVH